MSNAQTQAKTQSNPQFLTQVFERLPKLPELLEQACPGGITVSPEELAEKLGFERTVGGGLIASIVKLGDLPGWEIKKGAFGGIGRSGFRTERGDKPHNRQLIERQDPAPSTEFLLAVKRILNQQIPEQDTQKVLKAWEVGNLLPTQGFQSGSPSEDAIRYALRHGMIPGFVNQAGIKAGIRRLRKGEEPNYSKEEKQAPEQKTDVPKLASPYQGGQTKSQTPSPVVATQQASTQPQPRAQMQQLSLPNQQPVNTPIAPLAKTDGRIHRTTVVRRRQKQNAS